MMPNNQELVGALYALSHLLLINGAAYELQQQYKSKQR